MSGTLRLCGLGLSPEQTATVDSLHALGRCDVVFVDGGPGELAFVASYCPGLKPRPYRGGAAATAAVLKELSRGKTVGLAARGHPLLFGGGGGELARRCRQAGAACESYGAVSAVDVALAVLGRTLGVNIHGIQIYDADAFCVARRVLTDQPLVIAFGARADAVVLRRVLRALRVYFPGEHACRVLGPGTRDPVAEPTLAEYEERLRPARPWMVVYVPAKAVPR